MAVVLVSFLWDVAHEHPWSAGLIGATLVLSWIAENVLMRKHRKPVEKDSKTAT